MLENDCESIYLSFTEITHHKYLINILWGEKEDNVVECRIALLKTSHVCISSLPERYYGNKRESRFTVNNCYIIINTL